MTNDKLKDMLARHEGVRFKPYKCPAGFNTIGIGHNYDANPLPKDTREYLDKHGEITPAMVDKLLDSDIAMALAACKRLYPEFDGFSEQRQNALQDWLFNIGEGTARKFQVTNRAINEGRWDDAAQGMTNSRWFKQVGNRSKEIVAMIKEG
jgi:lysozyme